MSSPLDAVSTYILAKDGNRPFLIKQAFAEDAVLEIEVKTDAISFPSSAKGLNAIEDILVRRFGNDYENIYTFCLSRPSAADRLHFACHWLVGMSAKSGGQLRVGCGKLLPRYHSITPRLTPAVERPAARGAPVTGQPPAGPLQLLVRPPTAEIRACRVHT